MSEFIAEAQVLVVPSTAGFRAELLAQLTAIQRSIPGLVIPVSGFDSASLRTAAAGVVAASTDATAAINGETASLTRLSRSSVEAAGAQKILAASQLQVSTAAKNAERGVFTQVASLAGLRGAVLGANSAFILGAAGAIAFFGSLQLAAGVEQDLATFRVTAGATADELTRVSETARELGRDISLPGVGARDAVRAMLALAKAGLSVEDSMDAARGVLQLATAAEIDNALAAELVANSLNAFGLAGDKAVKIADLLANAANASQASLEDMGIALRQSAASAQQVGLSVNDTVVLLTQLARAGIAGSDAGTTLRVALARLIAPTKNAAVELRKLGVDLRDAQGNVRPDIFAQIGVALQGVDRASQDNAFITIFGQNAQRVASILARQGVPALQDAQVALRKEGTAAEVAGAKNEGLAGSVENAKNQFAAFSLEVGQLAAPLAALGLDATALLFGTLADSLHGIHEAWKQQIDDLGEVAATFKLLSDESGFTEFVRTVDEGGKAFQDDLERAGRAAKGFVSDLFGVSTSAKAAEPPLAKLSQTAITFARDAGDATTAASRLASSLDEIAKSGRAASAKAVLNLDIESARAGGSDQDLLGLLREREDNLQAFIDRLSKREQTKAVVETLTKANQDLANVRQEIQSLLDQRAQDTERAANDAEQARSKADSAFLDLLQGKRDARERFISQAEGTKSLKDDIILRLRFVNLLNKQIENIRKTVTDAKVRASVIAGLTAQLVQIGNELKNLRKAQREALVAAAEERQQRIEQSVQLDIDFAQITGNRSAEIRARQRLITLLKKELKEVKKGTNAWKELRNAIAEQQQAIKDAQEQNKQTGQTVQQSQFSFLQTQQGFAANLLGNLIPGFATGGLVGGSGQQSAGDLRQSAEGAGALTRDRGVRPVQVDTTNAILRRILAALNNLNGRASHPEARYQNRVAGSNMDTIGGV